MKKLFGEYIKSVFQIERDLRFWRHFLSYTIEKYQEENLVNRTISDALFGIYDIAENNPTRWFSPSQETLTIEIKDLKFHSNELFCWIMNTSIVRLYNSLELLLTQAIHLQYFSDLNAPSSGKMDLQNVLKEIRDYLKQMKVKLDTKNNRYLIQFLTVKSEAFKNFASNTVHVDSKLTWQEFFELVSVLRHIVAHHGMLVNADAQNELLSKGKDLFRFHFKIDESRFLNPNADNFLIFVALFNDFAGNSLKFIANENDLAFLGF